MALSSDFRTLILFTVMAAFVECQITSVNSKVACIDGNVDIDWVYGNTADVLSVTWTYIDSQTSTQTTIMQFAGGSATVSNNYNVKHKTNGGITLTKVTKANSGSYKISVIYATAPAADDTVAVTVNDCSSTPVPPTAPTTSPPTPSTTIIVLSVVGGAIVILIICIIVCILLRKKSNREKKYRADSENAEMPQVDINEVDINEVDINEVDINEVDINFTKQQ